MEFLDVQTENKVINNKKKLKIIRMQNLRQFFSKLLLFKKDSQNNFMHLLGTSSYLI